MDPQETATSTTPTLDAIRASAADLNSGDPAKRARAEEIKRRYEQGLFNDMLIKEGAQPVKVNKPPIDVGRVISEKEAEQAEIQPEMPETEPVKGIRGNTTNIGGAIRDIPDDFLQMGRNIKERFEGRTERLAEDQLRRAEDGWSIRELGGQGLGYVAATLATAVDAVSEGGIFLGKSLLTEENEQAISQKFQEGVEKVVTSERMQPVIQQTADLVAAYNTWAELNPEDAANVQDVGSIVLSLAELYGYKALTSGAKAATPVAREAVDAATDVIKSSAAQGLKAADKVDEAARTGLQRFGKTVDEAFEGRRQAVFDEQAEIAQTSVRRITQGPEKDLAANSRALVEMNPQGIRTYQELDDLTTSRIRAISDEQTNYLRRFPEKYTPDELAKKTTVGDEVVSEDFIQQAIDGLETAYTKQGELVKAAQVRQLGQRYADEGLNVAEMNALAKEYGIEFRSRAFSKLGDPKEGYNAEAFENIRKGIKETLRDKLPDNKSKEIDARISDLYTLKGSTEKMRQKVFDLESKARDAGLLGEFGEGVANVADFTVFGAIRNLIGAVGKRRSSMNALDLQKELTKMLDEINELNAMKDAPNFEKRFTEWYDNLPVGLSIKNVGDESVKKNLDSYAGSVGATMPGKIKGVEIKDAEVPQMYHGTKDASFLDRGERMSPGETGFQGPGIYWTASPDDAKGWSQVGSPENGGVIELNLKSDIKLAEISERDYENMMLDTLEDMKKNPEQFGFPKNGDGIDDRQAYLVLQEQLEEMGYGGIRFKLSDAQLKQRYGSTAYPGMNDYGIIFQGDFVEPKRMGSFNQGEIPPTTGTAAKPLVNPTTNQLNNPEPGMVFYHGTTPENKASLLKNGIDTELNTKGSAEAPDAFYVGDKGEASMYGNDFVGIQAKPGETIKTLDAGSQEWADVVGISTSAEMSKAGRAELKRRGYDAVNHGDEIEILNPAKFEVVDLDTPNVGITDARSLERAKSIQEKGLIRAMGGRDEGASGLGDGVYATSYKDGAELAIQDAGEGVVVSFKIPKKEISKLEIDEDMGYDIFGQEAYDEGSFFYKGNVPPSWITKIEDKDGNVLFEQKGVTGLDAYHYSTLPFED